MKYNYTHAYNTNECKGMHTQTHSHTQRIHTHILKIHTHKHTRTHAPMNIDPFHA